MILVAYIDKGRKCSLTKTIKGPERILQPFIKTFSVI